VPARRSPITVTELRPDLAAWQPMLPQALEHRMARRRVDLPLAHDLEGTTNGLRRGRKPLDDCSGGPIKLLSYNSTLRIRQ
jgi:hypothetical protein